MDFRVRCILEVRHLDNMAPEELSWEIIGYYHSKAVANIRAEL
jgi:hypothetical protein